MEIYGEGGTAGTDLGVTLSSIPTGPNSTGSRPPPKPGTAHSGVTSPPRLPEQPVRSVSVKPGPVQPRAQALTPAKPVSNLARRAGRVLRVTLYTTVPLLLLGLMALGITYVRLRHGPIAFDVLVPPIERGINAELSSYSVKIEGADLRLGESGELEFRLRQLSVLESDGVTVAVAPLAAVNISTAALWRAAIVPARVELIDPVINLVYTDDGGLALDTSVERIARAADGSGADSKLQARLPAATGTAVQTPAQETTQAKGPVPGRQLNLAKMLSDASRRARRRLDATAYLTEFGLRNASVVLNYAGQKSAWRVPEASVDFNHARRRSVISGRATVASQRGPWSLSFVTDETDKTDRLQVKATVRDLVPSTLSAAAPPLALLKMFDVPLAGDATVDLATSGEIERSEIALEVGAGNIAHPDLAQPFKVVAGLFRLTYDGQDRRWDLQPSPVKWGDGSIQFSGIMKDVADGNSMPLWRFEFDGKNGVFEAADFQVPPVTIDTFTVKGALVPRRGLVEVTEFRVTGGGGEIGLKGQTQSGPSGQSTAADVTISAMPLATVKALWPRALATGAREWVGERVTETTFKGGSLRFRTGAFVTDAPPAAPGQKVERLTATFEAANSSFIALPGMAPIQAPRALIQIADNALEVAVPEAAVVLPGNRTVPLKAGRLTAQDVMLKRTEGEITFSTLAQLGPFLETIEQLPVRAVREAAPFPKAGDGKVDAQFKIKLPLVSKLDADDVVIEGKAKITDGRFGKAGGQFDVQGFTLALELSEKALDAKGDLLVNGVPAKITGQRVFGAEADQQPPMKITASLDEADRTQLGLDINDLVRGVVPVEISLQKAGRPEPVVRLKADLTNAEIAIDAIAWRKPAGRAAILETDIVSGKTHKTELQNFKVAGDDIALEGWVGIGADSKMREFLFPAFSLNVISRLEVQGTLGSDNIWKVKAHGPTFDGRELFKSLFSVGDGQDRKKKSAKSSDGTDISAEIANVIGGSEVSLRGFKMKLSTRADKLSSLDAKGTLDGGAPLAAVLDTQSGPRRLLVDSPDSGQVMRLMDFYPNVQGGRLRLEVNLDGKGPAEKTGVLWIDDFKVLGDPIVSEVVGSADQGRPAISGKRKVSREVFEFDSMRAPFSVGYGQFVLEESYLKGPVLGANLRGKVDFKTRKINLGGTYIPLQGLNGAFGGIPLLGQILSGAHGEGIFGITFAVQGPLSEPQVLVNPLSLVAPGIFRDVFQMTTANPQVQVRDDRAPAKPAEQRVRASSEPGATPQRREPKMPPVIGEPVDGWSSTTNP